MDCFKIVNLGKNAQISTLVTLGVLDLLQILHRGYIWYQDVVELVLDRNLRDFLSVCRL